MFEDNKEVRVPVRMIANRDMIRDNIYSTGEWDRDEVKLVPESVSRKLFQHTDVYAPASAEEAKASAAKMVGEDLKDTGKKQAEEAEQQLRDEIANMPRDTVIEYAATHYGQTIKGNLSAENARAALVALVDQYGVQ